MTDRLDRDEREGLEEELHDVDRLVSELLEISGRASKRVGRGRPLTNAYHDLAGTLSDLAMELSGSPDVTAMRRRLDADEQAQADQEAGQQRRAYFSGVL